MLRVELAATGKELTSGQIADSNSAWLAEQLFYLGAPVSRVSTVGDEVASLSDLLQEIASRAQLALVTGGLGSTSDDVTVQAAAKSSGKTLVQDPAALQSVRDFWRRHRQTGKLPEEIARQALVPENSLVLPNPVGVAPGFGLYISDCLFFFLPGVPREMREMFHQSVQPGIRKQFPQHLQPQRTRSLQVFGLTESATARTLEDLPQFHPDVELGYRFLFPQIRITLYADATRTTEEEVDNAQQWALERLGENVISLREESLPQVVGKLLREREATISLAESCTGGLISARTTSVAGSSDYFLQAAVTYSDQAKISLLGVSEGTLQEHGAVHEATAREMALGVQQLSGSDYAISATGVAGPSGGTEEKPVGTVCIGLASPHKVTAKRIQRDTGSRENNQLFFADCALDLLRRSLLRN